MELQKVDLIDCCDFNFFPSGTGDCIFGCLQEHGFSMVFLCIVKIQLFETFTLCFVKRKVDYHCDCGVEQTQNYVKFVVEPRDADGADIISF